MKLTVGDIRFSESGPVNVLATVDVESEKYLSPICSISVTAPMVEGQAIREYDEYLKNKAREVITKMYKEIVCGGNDVGESKAFKVEHGKIIINAAQVEFISSLYKGGLTLNAEGYLTATPIKLYVPNLDGGENDQFDCLGEKIEPSELGCKMKVAINDGDTDKELEERVAALEKRLGEQSSTDMLKAIHEASKKAALDFLSQSKHQIGECDEYFVDFPFRITDKCGQLFVHDEEGAGTPTHKHRDAIIARVIHDLKSENGNMLKRLGRCMGLLQVAAEIEAVNQICESECERCRESILSDFDNPPFKNAPIGWISPGVKYLKRRI
ncbi:hypothetical protein RNH31_005430 [Salmonella enterica]|nr:hypothetical protein [Salmonella enterica]